MVNSLVDRATSEHLKAPDQAKIREIVTICIRDAVQAKVAIKNIKKRLQSRSARVQLLCLILLDALVRCGDVVQGIVIERQLLIDMIKIINRKPDYRVKEKILMLIDSWQETLGGAGAKRPQFYSAYLDLKHAGVTFPQRPEKPTTPKPTPPPEAHAVKSQPQVVFNADRPKVEDISPKENPSPSLSSTEIQSAQDTMKVLEEMLTALDPKNKEVLSKDVIAKHCGAYKQIVSQLMNSTTDESLLQQGHALNDKMQLLLTKNEATASATPIPIPQVETPKPKYVGSSVVKTDAPSKTPKPKFVGSEVVKADAPSKTPTPKSAGNLIVKADAPSKTTKPKSAGSSVVKVDDPLIDTEEDNKHSDRFASNADQSLVVANGQPSSPKKVDPEMDLLSLDDFSSLPTAENSLSIVPARTLPIANSHNDLALIDMFSQVSAYPNGPVSNPVVSQYELSLYNPYFNGQITQPASPVYGNHTITTSTFPQTPWESAQSSQPYSPTTQVIQIAITNPHSSMPNHPGSQVTVTQHSHPTGLYSPQVQIGHTGFGYGSAGYQSNMGYGRINENRMSSLSLNDDCNSVYSLPTIKRSIAEDDLFGDLVVLDRTKFKPGKAVIM